jgi:NAD+ kinase
MNPPVSRIGLVFKKHDQRTPGILKEIIPWLESRNITVFLDEETAGQAGVSCRSLPGKTMAESSDIVAVFGGDGTFLAVARMVAGHGTPILGVNLGSLGFLTEVKLEEVRVALESVLVGSYAIEDRILLQLELTRKRRVLETYQALNDGVINKGALARIIELEVLVDSQPFSTFRADGLIVSTPTGSTAYSLSAGGPIVYPTLQAFLITPICPHALTNRPVVVPDNSVIEVVLRHGKDVMLTVDGQVGAPMSQGDRLTIRKSESTIRFIQSPGNTFFKTLREKLKWS